MWRLNNVSGETMDLNFPGIERLAACENLLIAGMGGGFDIFCGLPIYAELRRRGCTVHLANLSFSQLAYLKNGVTLTEHVAGVTAESNTFALYFPELHLARWLQQERGESATIWTINAQGARPVLAAFRAIVEHLSIDGILLVDGGVDSLMRGDEAEMGTILEDGCSLAAVDEMTEVPLRWMTCAGFGAEREVTYAHVFENIAGMTRDGGFLGACSLIPEMEAYRVYETAVEYAHAQRGQDPSVIHASIVSAARGEYGDYHHTERTKGSRLWISPLMPLYWVFDLPVVARRNLFLPYLRHSSTFRDALDALATARSRVTPRKAARVSL